MNQVLLKFICNAINFANFLFVNVNEVMTIDDASWISLHFYAIQGWNQILLLVCVEKVNV
jgi:hypothetical protein